VIRFAVRWAFRGLILVIVLAVALVLLKDILAKALAEHELEARSGLEVKIGSLELGLFEPTVTLEDVKVYNRATFGGSPLLDAPDLHIEYDPGALLNRRLHLNLLRLSLAEINVVETQDGRTNLIIRPDAPDSRPGPPAQPDRVLGFTFAGIETVNLSLNRLRYTNLKRPDKPTELQLGLRNQIFTKVRSVQELTNLVLKAMFRNGITVLSPAAEGHKPTPTKPRGPRPTSRN
jgi:hypothetical protein